MLELTAVSDRLLGPVTAVVESLRAVAPGLDLDAGMLVGAWSRDVLHAAQGHHFAARATWDLDVGLALDGWHTYGRLADAFPRQGDSGVGFRIGGAIVDLLPFGGLEQSPGIVRPPTRNETISVWAFAEVFAAALRLPLSGGLAIRCPSAAGYTALKTAAWLDRAKWGESKDAGDLALSAFWYAESEEVNDRLYDTVEGQSILVIEDMDVPRSAAHLLGRDVVAIIGSERAGELRQRWPGPKELLLRNFSFGTERRSAAVVRRREEIVDAFTRGLTTRL